MLSSKQFLYQSQKDIEYSSVLITLMATLQCYRKICPTKSLFKIKKMELLKKIYTNLLTLDEWIKEEK